MSLRLAYAGTFYVKYAALLSDLEKGNVVNYQMAMRYYLF